jgi:hypothetical protein
MIKIDKGRGFWYKASIYGNLGFDAGDLMDDLAYQIYINEEVKKSWSVQLKPQAILIQNRGIYNRYYAQAKQMIREEKIKRITKKCHRDIIEFVGN